jgi:BNR/Asp-box repeat.
MRAHSLHAAFLCLAIISLSSTAFAQNKIKVDTSTFGAIEARHIGPAVTSGRIAALDGVASDPRIIYAGAAAGGVWKSINGGATFKPVFDKYTQSIGAITIDQSRPDTVWVGTGESWTRNSTSVGTGLYKTTDGGDTWKRVGLENSERIAQIVIDPKNSDTVYVAATGHLWDSNEERGVYKTTDGGKTWQRALFVDKDTGCADIAIDPQEPNIVYAAMWQFRRKPYFFTSGGRQRSIQEHRRRQDLEATHKRFAGRRAWPNSDCRRADSLE